MTAVRQKKENYEADRREGCHFARIPNPVWERVEAARSANLDLAVLGGVSQAIVKLLEEALEVRNRKRSKRK